MSGFGLCHVKQEGSPAHPDDVYIHCGCAKCEERFKRQAKAYFDFRRSQGTPEEILSLETYYEAPSK